MKSNPPGGRGWHYYYLFGLERAGVLTDKKFIGDHDWYREGASYLLEKQLPEGFWETQANEYGTAVSNTCFALLFLKRSTPPPVITLKK